MGKLWLWNVYTDGYGYGYGHGNLGLIGVLYLLSPSLFYLHVYFILNRKNYCLLFPQVCKYCNYQI